MSISLSAILRRRNIILAEHGGSLADARERLPVWRQVWADFRTFSQLVSLVRQDGRVPDFARDMAYGLADIGCLAIEDEGRSLLASIPDTFAKRLLTGGWLEELGACAMSEAGADEVRFGQRIEWRSGADPSVNYTNEIDVIGRFTDKLMLVSCKAMRPGALQGAAGRSDDVILEAMLEIHYWSEHFGGEDIASPALLTTVDMIDEGRRRPRHAGLHERARVLDLALLPADLAHYDAVVDALRCRAASLSS